MLQAKFVISTTMHNTKSFLSNNLRYNNERILDNLSSNSTWLEPTSYNGNKLQDTSGAKRIDFSASTTLYDDTETVLQYDAAAIGGRDRIVVTYVIESSGTYELYFTVRELSAKFDASSWDETSILNPTLLETTSSNFYFPRVTEITPNEGNFVICYNQAKPFEQTYGTCRFYNQDLTLATSIDLQGSVAQDDTLLDLNIYKAQSNLLLVSGIVQNKTDLKYKVYLKIISVTTTNNTIIAYDIIDQMLFESDQQIKQQKAIWLNSNYFILAYRHSSITKGYLRLMSYKLIYDSTTNVYSLNSDTDFFTTLDFETSEYNIYWYNGYDLAYVKDYEFLLVYTTDISAIGVTIPTLVVRHYKITEINSTFHSSYTELFQFDNETGNVHADNQHSRPTITPINSQSELDHDFNFFVISWNVEFISVIL